MRPAILATFAALAGVSSTLGMGCGGSATPTVPKPAETRPTTSATPTTTTTPANTIHATLVGENHSPIVDQPWHYRVTVTDARGHRLSGTETTHYTFNGAVVGTEKPVVVKFRNGVYDDTIEFPAKAVGYPLDVQTVIRTSLGSVTLEWPIKVQR